MPSRRPNTSALAPTPSATVRTATAENPGARPSARAAYRPSRQARAHHRDNCTMVASRLQYRRDRKRIAPKERPATVGAADRGSSLAPEDEGGINPRAAEGRDEGGEQHRARQKS